MQRQRRPPHAEAAVDHGGGAVIAVATWLLTLCGLALVGIGGYFILARPALLPEDARFMGTTPAALLAAAPGLARWLRRVFWVLGGHITATGLLVAYLANIGLRTGAGGALIILALAWATSIGGMARVSARH